MEDGKYIEMALQLNALQCEGKVGEVNQFVSKLSDEEKKRLKEALSSDECVSATRYYFDALKQRTTSDLVSFGGYSVGDVVETTLYSTKSGVDSEQLIKAAEKGKEEIKKLWEFRDHVGPITRIYKIEKLGEIPEEYKCEIDIGYKSVTVSIPSSINRKI